jgi:hypothetical protein
VIAQAARSDAALALHAVVALGFLGNAGGGTALAGRLFMTPSTRLELSANVLQTSKHNKNPQ